MREICAFISTKTCLGGYVSLKWSVTMQTWVRSQPGPCGGSAPGVWPTMLQAAKRGARSHLHTQVVCRWGPFFQLGFRFLQHIPTTPRTTAPNQSQTIPQHTITFKSPSTAPQINDNLIHNSPHKHNPSPRTPARMTCCTSRHIWPHAWSSSAHGVQQWKLSTYTLCQAC